MWQSQGSACDASWECPCGKVHKRDRNSVGSSSQLFPAALGAVLCERCTSLVLILLIYNCSLHLKILPVKQRASVGLKLNIKSKNQMFCTFHPKSVVLVLMYYLKNLGLVLLFCIIFLSVRLYIFTQMDLNFCKVN